MIWTDCQRESFELTPSAPPVVPPQDSQVPSTQVSATETVPGQPALRTPPERIVGTTSPAAVAPPVPVLDTSKPSGPEAGRLTPTVPEESEVGESVSQHGDGPDAKSSQRDGYWRPHITIFKCILCPVSVSSTWMHGYPYPCRLYRYFKPKGGKVKCSPEALQMWESKSGRFPAAMINS